MRNTEFIDHSNERAAYLEKIKAFQGKCRTCGNEIDPKYTLCDPCAAKLPKCIECKKEMTDAQVKFSQSVYGKLLCWADQPAQVRAREMARGGGNNE